MQPVKPSDVQQPDPVAPGGTQGEIILLPCKRNAASGIFEVTPEGQEQARALRPANSGSTAGSPRLSHTQSSEGEEGSACHSESAQGGLAKPGDVKQEEEEDPNKRKCSKWTRWTPQQDLSLLLFFQKQGKKWSKISRQMQGLTKFQVRRRFFTLLEEMRSQEGLAQCGEDQLVLLKINQLRMAQPMMYPVYFPVMHNPAMMQLGPQAHPMQPQGPHMPQHPLVMQTPQAHHMQTLGQQMPQLSLPPMQLPPVQTMMHHAPPQYMQSYYPH